MRALRAAPAPRSATRSGPRDHRLPGHRAALPVRRWKRCDRRIVGAGPAGHRRSGRPLDVRRRPDGRRRAWLAPVLDGRRLWASSTTRTSSPDQPIRLAGRPAQARPPAPGRGLKSGLRPRAAALAARHGDAPAVQHDGLLSHRRCRTSASTNSPSRWARPASDSESTPSTLPAAERSARATAACNSRTSAPPAAASAPGRRPARGRPPGRSGRIARTPMPRSTSALSLSGYRAARLRLCTKFSQALARSPRPTLPSRD